MGAGRDAVVSKEADMARVDMIQRYLVGESIVDEPDVVERKLRNYCKELINYYLACEARRAELFADAMASRIDLRAQRALIDEYGEFRAGGDGRHLQFVQWLDLREGK